MTVDWHIQGEEVDLKHSRSVAMPSLVKTTDDTSVTWQPQYGQPALSVDRTVALGPTTAVIQQHESERWRGLSTAAIESFVSFHRGGGIFHLQPNST